MKHNVYLVAKYTATPRNRSQTYKSGYVTDSDNMQWNEEVDVVTRLKDKDLVSARIILNIIEQKVVKNNFNNDKSFMELFQYFYTSSPKEISHALQRVGISVAEPKETTDGEVEHVSEDVQAESEASERPESAATAELVIPSKRTKTSKRGNIADAESDASAAATDRPTETGTETSELQD